MEKKVFEMPIIEIIEINQEDIITTSGARSFGDTFEGDNILDFTNF